MNRRTKQISLPIETGEGKVSGQWVREAPIGALEFSRKPGKGHAVKNLAKGLKAEAVRYKLSLGWELKTEIPAYP